MSDITTTKTRTVSTAGNTTTSITTTGQSCQIFEAKKAKQRQCSSQIKLNEKICKNNSFRTFFFVLPVFEMLWSASGRN